MNNNLYKISGENINGIYSFINEIDLEGNNLNISNTYNKFSLFYHIWEKIFFRIKFGGENNFRNDFLKYINVNNNDIVLETSVGTAGNFKFLNKNAKYYGADISMGMLKKALKNVKNWKINAELNFCEAENLPYKDNIFDVVYSCGGFKLYNNKQNAVNEMIRVSKPGKKIYIIDGTEETVRKMYKKNPGINICDNSMAKIPLEFIPKGMKNIEWKILCKGYMYILSFDK